MVPENKQNRRYKQINFIDLQNNHRPSQHTVGNVHIAADSFQKLYERCQPCVVKDDDYFEGKYS
jgi:hypothetical protein